MSDNQMFVAGDMKNVVDMQFRTDSLRGYFQGAREHLELIACEEVRGMDEAHKARFFEKTVLAIISDEKLKPCFESVEGKISIKRVAEFAVETGLIPSEDFYAIPYKKKIKVQGGDDRNVSVAEIIEREEGLRKLALGGKRPLMKSLKHFPIYAADTAYNEKKGIPLVDGKLGEINYYPAIVKDKGELLGVAIAHVMADGEKGANFIPIDRILTSRDHSESYRNYLKEVDEWVKLEAGEDKTAKRVVWNDGTVTFKVMRYNSWKKTDEEKTIYKPQKTVWDTDFVRKCEIAALKIYLKPWIRVREAVGAAMYSDEAPAKPSMETVLKGAARTWEEVDGDLDGVGEGVDDEPGPEVTGVYPDGGEKKLAADVDPGALF